MMWQDLIFLQTLSSILKNKETARAVVPKIKVQDAIKQIIDSAKKSTL